MDERIIIEKGTSYLKIFTITIIVIGLIIGCIAGGVYCSEHWIAGAFNFFCVFLAVSAPITIVALIINLAFSKIRITVTDKRVYGCAIFGKRVDLPLDSISAVAMYNFSQGIAVASSSGRIKFSFVKDSRDVFDEISKLLMDRQNQNKSKQNKTDLSSLKEYKELLDIGAITTEEYEAKKKELLNK